MSENSLTVSELNNFIRDVLKSGFPQSVWICGEIQELREKNGHLYFTLSEKEETTHNVLAKIGVSIWVNSRIKIEALLSKSENQFTLKEDIQVKLLCKVDFYPPFGQVRLIAENIDPIYTLGKIAQDRHRIIAQLKKQGTLDLNKTLHMSLVPLHIGLITSYDSAAYHDFIDELKKCAFGFKVNVIDCAMQGKNTEGSVVSAIQHFSSLSLCDVIVITRGGGSVTDLSAFDSVLIAQSIAACRIPVLTGIGHEINTTITDLAAHTFTKTPTATAQWLIGRVNEFYINLKDKEQKLITIVQNGIERRKNILKEIAHILRQETQELLKKHSQKLSTLTLSFTRAPLIKLRQNNRFLQDRSDNLKKTIQLNLQRTRTKIESYVKVIDVLDPKNTLKRGFTITRTDQRVIIKSVKHLKNIKNIHTEFFDGEITTQL